MARIEYVKLLQEVIHIGVKYYSGMSLIRNFVGKVFPEVDIQLDHWKRVFQQHEHDELGKQALSSITLKKFHAQGGSVYALYPKANLEQAVKFIVALQTISDYLDNLCDRTGVFDQNAFRQLHVSMLDAVDPKRGKSDYYSYYPYKDDSGYLNMLVDTCRTQIKQLPSYHIVMDKIKIYIELYSQMQTYKHLDPAVRENALSSWADKHTTSYPGIQWWEFSAAAGSTLGVFLLFAAAADPNITPEDVASIDQAYFPWVCGLHILLDYYIDYQEDLVMGDLNFTYYYETLKQCEDRIMLFINNSLAYCSRLQYPGFHTTIIKGLLAMYLSDPKAHQGINTLTTKSLIRSGGLDASLYYNICRLLRTAGKL